MATPCASSDLGWFGNGTFLFMWDTSQSPAVWVKISKIDNHDGPGMTTDKEEVTTHDSVAGYKQYIAGLSDGGSITESMIWDPTDPTHAGLAYTSLKQAFDDKQNRKWKLVYPTSPKWGTVFCGFVDAYKAMAPVKSALRAQVTIKVSDKVDLVTGGGLT